MQANCSLLGTLFILSIVCVIVGHGAGVLAWRHRLPQYSRWRWLSDPTYAYRSSYYREPKPPLRLVAATFLTLAAVLILVLVVLVIAAERAGATGICGFGV